MASIVFASILEECLCGQSLMFTEEIYKLFGILDAEIDKHTCQSGADPPPPPLVWMKKVLQFENNCNGRSETGQGYVLRKTRK